MSSTARVADRVEHDSYPTPAWAIQAILSELGEIPPGRILEPAAGTGAILRELRSKWPTARLAGVEIDEAAAKICQDSGFSVHCGDFLKCQTRDTAHVDLVITNPPYLHAQEFAEHALKVGREVALLLRLGFLAGIERGEFHRKHPCDVFVLPRRPAFVASIVCQRGKRESADGSPSCAWRTTLPIEMESPKFCPGCGTRTRRSTTDSAEYAWLVFGPGRGGRWKRLAID